jgi:poly-gamma-glutamate capsule biosynthesis protein CapA/YwtB (metallophosphatase superfamily)
MASPKKIIRLQVNVLLLVAGYSLILNANTAFDDALVASGFLKNEKEIRMIAVGDVMLSRGVERKMIAKKNYKYPFVATSKFISGADIVFGNLETPMIKGRSINDMEMVFRTDPKSVKGLKFAGFNVMSIANNHIMNFGLAGLQSTIKNLDENNIMHVGAGLNEDDIYKPAFKEIKGTKFAFLGFTYNHDQRKDANGDIYGVASMEKEKMQQMIEKTKLEADVVIVSMHAGSEYKILSGSFQENFAHDAIDAGADVVIGHHPHVVQNSEIYKGKYIFYSLGNFVFDQMWSEETRLGSMLEIIIEEKEIVNIRLIPVKIFDYSQPKVIGGKSGKMILDRLKFH